MMDSIKDGYLSRDLRRLKICLAASGGGHLTQLLGLKESWEGHNNFWVVTSDLVRDALERQGRVYIVTESNRQHPLLVLKALFSCIRIVYQERPQVVISTGAAVGCLMSFLGKISGAKIIWIDSITNIEGLSLSGRLVRYIADLFLVQWPNLAKGYENAEFAGAII
jgi:UDP-N-acetylglucosamine:LPS N-acetylglucosamine transferase